MMQRNSSKEERTPGFGLSSTTEGPTTNRSSSINRGAYGATILTEGSKKTEVSMYKTKAEIIEI